MIEFIGFTKKFSDSKKVNSIGYIFFKPTGERWKFLMKGELPPYSGDNNIGTVTWASDSDSCVDISTVMMNGFLRDVIFLMGKKRAKNKKMRKILNYAMDLSLIFCLRDRMSI